MKNHNVSGSGQEQNTRFIVFEDALMKEMCIKAFDMDGDGELSYAEAAAVTDLGKMKLTNRDFRSFNEFQYFTSVKAIPDRYYEDCRNLASIVIPDSVTSIGNWAFTSCDSLESIVIPNSVTSIGDCAFASCYRLESIVIPESVTNIGDIVFTKCKSLESIVIPDGVTSMGKLAFTWCDSLESIKIPDSVTNIGNWDFAGCDSLVSIVIPDSVKSIGYLAFYRCSSLKNVYAISENPADIYWGTFSQCNALKKIYVPEKSVRIYKEAESWRDYASLIEGCDFSESVDQSHEKIHVTKEESNEKNLITYIKELLFSRFSHIRRRK